MDHIGIETHDPVDDARLMWALIPRRFDGWVSATCCLAAVAGPLRRWRPHPSNPLCAGEHASPLTSANTRLTEPREIGPTLTGSP